MDAIGVPEYLRMKHAAVLLAVLILAVAIAVLLRSRGSAPDDQVAPEEMPEMIMRAQIVRARYEELLAEADMAPYLMMSPREAAQWRQHVMNYETRWLVLRGGDSVEVAASFPFVDPFHHGDLGDDPVDQARALIDQFGAALLLSASLEPFLETVRKKR